MYRSVGFIVSIVLGLIVTASLEAATITYTDKLGRRVTITTPVNRAVFFLTYELIPALGVWDKVVGIGKWAYDNDLMQAVKPDIANKIPSVGSGSDVNIEALLKLKPDLVITWTFKPENVRFMEEKGLKVIAIYPETLEELIDVMRLHGKLFRKEKEMDLSIAEMQKIFRFIKERESRLSSHERKKVLWIGSKPTSVACGIGVTNDIFKLIGGINQAGTIQQRNADIPIEKIIAWNPEVIFIWGNARYTAKDIIDNPQWRYIKAVKEGKVYKSADWSTWSLRLAPVALWMAMKTYPELYMGVDIEKVADDFYRKVFNIPYNKVKKIE